MSADDRQALPEWLGDYRVAGLIRKGAMAEVYRGFSREGRSVAIKVLDSNLRDDPDATARLAREAEILKKIHHPNVAELLEFGTAPDKRPYLVCELIDGPTLKEIIDRRERPDILKGLDWMEEAAEALQEAWIHHIIHRDIKPENLMINTEGRVKVVDFGLAKAVFSDPALNQGKTVLGTPRYMSPEMILGQSLDLRSDMYSLGATFYHYFTGESPFEAGSHEEMMKRHATSSPPPPHSIEPGLPEDLCYILMRLMSKDPSERYETYDDLIDHLRKTRLALMSREGFLGGSAYQTPEASAYEKKHPKSGEVAVDSNDTLDKEAAAAAERRKRAQAIVIEQPQEGGFRRTLVMAVVLAALIGGGAFTYQSYKYPNETGKFRENVSELLTKLGMPQPRAKQERQEWEEQNYVKIELNAERMQDLMSLILTYQTRKGYLPSSLDVMVQDGYLKPGETKDVWGRDFAFLPAAGMLYSYGADGEEYTRDDFKLNLEMTFISRPHAPTGA